MKTLFKLCSNTHHNCYTVSSFYALPLQDLSPVHTIKNLEKLTVMLYTGLYTGMEKRDTNYGRSM